MDPILSGVAETLLIPLWARAKETKHPQPIIRDPKSVELLETLNYDFSKFQKDWATQLSIAIRTHLIDQQTLAFLQKYPQSTVINLGAGLDTRFSRLDNGQILWYELDQPEVIQLKHHFFQETERYRWMGQSVLDFSWLKKIAVPKSPVLIIAEGLFMYLSPPDVQQLIQQILSYFPQGEIIFEAIGPGAVGRSNWVPSVAKMQKPIPQFLWGLRNTQNLTLWDPRIQLFQEWHMFDLYPHRWKWIWWSTRFPRIKKWIGHRIVHVGFTSPKY
ncbi:MAG: class I SAM-dependent methyltransferase [Planctomycetota bacterium]